MTKYQGIFPAFYACYDKEGRVDTQVVRTFAKYLLDKGVKGLYVGGSSGECIYQSVCERKETLEAVMAEVGGKLTVIAHVACNNTADSRELAKGREVQNECCRIIYKMCSAQGNMYAVIKEIIRLQGGPDIGSVRAPLLELAEDDKPIIAQAHEIIQAAIAKYC